MSYSVKISARKVRHTFAEIGKVFASVQPLMLSCLTFCLIVLLGGCALSNTSDFMPHGCCLAWNSQLLSLFVAGNSLIALSYYSISVGLWLFVRRRKDLAFHWLFLLFAGFILFCATSHLMKLWTIWYPNYWAEGFVDMLTGLISAFTAILLWPVIPKALQLKSPSQWEERNKELERLIEERDVAEKRANEFYSMVSHELRTPITAIRGTLGLIEGGVIESGSGEEKELIKTATISSDRLIRLIDEILDLKKIESGKMRLGLSVFDISDLLSATLAPLASIAAAAGVSLDYDRAVSGSVYADRDRAVQILTNLVSNALKFSEPGGAVSVATEPGEAGRVRFLVIDKGPGIADSDTEAIFKKFYQLDSSDTRQKGGTGLGLAISKALVEVQGGAIGVRSKPGVGSTFWFELAASAPICEGQS